MTNEEAIKIIKDYKVKGCGYCHQGGDEVEKAFNMAIKALAQKSKTDTWSIKEVADALEKHGIIREQEPTIKIGEPNFSQEQYLIDIQSAYDCGKSVIDKIRAEIENHCGLLKENHCKYCSYCNCVMGVREILELIDKHKEESIETKQGLAYADQETMMSAT